MKTHKDLIAWQKGINLVTDVYKITRIFPKEEMFCLVNQIRRAAVSVPLNIAEGAARFSKKEFTQFLYIALGSAVELETQFIICENLGYINNTISQDFLYKITEIRKTIMGLIKSLKN